MKKKLKKGFTLIELLMVVAIVALISTLAIQKLSGIQDEAKKKLNIANLQRVSAGIGAYVAAHTEDFSQDFNRLDSLTMWSSTTGSGNNFSGLKSVAELMCYSNNADNVNVGLSSELLKTPNQYAETINLLGIYYLTDSDVMVLKRDLGITYLMAGYPETEILPGYGYGDDGAYVTGSKTDADRCACVAVSNCAGRAVAVVNPAASMSDNTPVGPIIYKSMGQDVIYSGKTYHVVVKGKDCSNNEAAFQELMVGEGILMAFGLGDYCSIIGNNKAGIDSAPICPTMKKSEYRRYIILVRMTYTGKTEKDNSSGEEKYVTTYTAKKAEFAGVMDPAGNVISMLR